MMKVRKILLWGTPILMLVLITLSYATQRYIKNNWEYFTSNNSNERIDYAFQIIIGPEDTIRVARLGGISTYDGKDWETFIETGSNPDIAVDQSGHIWYRTVHDDITVIDINSGQKLDFEIPENEKCCHTIAVDKLRRLYVVSRRRRFTEDEERRGKDSYVLASQTHIDRKHIDFELYENWDIYRLLVFSPDGKVVAETRLTKPCQKIYVLGNRLFLIDGTIFQHILEYEMSFKE